MGLFSVMESRQMIDIHVSIIVYESDHLNLFSNLVCPWISPTIPNWFQNQM